MPLTSLSKSGPECLALGSTTSCPFAAFCVADIVFVPGGYGVTSEELFVLFVRCVESRVCRRVKNWFTYCTNTQEERPSKSDVQSKKADDQVDI